MFLPKKLLFWKTRWLLVAFFFTVGFFIIKQPARAQLLPPPISHGATVSATMPDIVPPSIPILISPENGSIVNTNRPQFVWRESTDNVAMSYYQLYLNGQLVVNNISTSGSFSQYNLSYNSGLGYYYLDPKFDIGQGHNTWKIMAVDAVGLTTSSATWNFLVDSIAPHFVITQVGEQDVSISTQDVSTIPEEPISLTANQPRLVARGEANSLVQLTIIIPGQDDRYGEIWIDGLGNWSYILPILPRDTVITLNFVIIDQARHISILEGVKIIIPSEIIVLPKTPVSPSPSPPKPGEPVLPPEKPPKKPIEIPYLPPKEAVHQVLRYLTPTPVWKVASRPWFAKLLNFVGPWLALLAVGWPLTIATILLASKYGGLVSFRHLWQIWQALGVMPWTEHEGWIFDADYYALDNKSGLLGVPFAQITAISQSERDGFPPYYQTAITNRLGLYSQLELPIKSYKLAMTHSDYRFPSILKREQFVDIEDFYKAELLEVTLDKNNLSLQVPADNDLLAIKNEDGGQSFSHLARTGRINKKIFIKQAWSFLTRIQMWLAEVVVYKNLIVLLNSLVAAVVILYWPSVINTTALSLYLMFGFLLVFKETLFANIRGLVVDARGEPIQDALVRLIELSEDDKQIKTNQITVALTDKGGRFNFVFKKGRYHIMSSYPNSPSIKHPKQENQLDVSNWWDQHRVVLNIKTAYSQ